MANQFDFWNSGLDGQVSFRLHWGSFWSGACFWCVVCASSRWWLKKHFLFSHRNVGKWSSLTSIFFRWVGSTTNQYLAILCDLFGMVKWPFQSLSDLQLGDKKVTLNHLVYYFMYLYFLIFSYENKTRSRRWHVGHLESKMFLLFTGFGWAKKNGMLYKNMKCIRKNLNEVGLIYHEKISSNIQYVFLLACLPPRKVYGIIPICEHPTNYCLSLILSTSPMGLTFSIMSQALLSGKLAWLAGKWTRIEDVFPIENGVSQLAMWNFSIATPEKHSEENSTELWHQQRRSQDDWEAYSKFQAEVGDSVQPLGETPRHGRKDFVVRVVTRATRSFWDEIFFCVWLKLVGSVGLTSRMIWSISYFWNAVPSENNQKTGSEAEQLYVFLGKVWLPTYTPEV